MASFWIYLLLAMSFSALFSGMEIAFVSANKLKIELDSKQGKFSAKILSFFLKKSAKFISTMLLGNNIAIVIYSMLMAKFLEPRLAMFTESQGLILLGQTIISTILILFFAEFLPKALFIINPNRVLTIAAIPLRIIYVLLYPFTVITVGISNLILKIFKVDVSESDLAFSKIDLEHFVMDIQERYEEGEEIDAEIQIFKNALDFSDVKVRECMIPRTEIVALEIEDSLTTLKDKFIETGLSKILIYRETIDNIIGYVHSKELFKNPEAIKSILLPVAVVPEAMSAQDLLDESIKNNRSIAVVVDEFGGTSGILTIEDIIEEIFGEIEDEHDKEELLEEKINENEFHVSARLEIDYLNDKYQLDLPESEEYETIAGLIIHLHESIPEKGEIIKHNQFVFTIQEVDENKIESLKIKRIEIED